MSDKKGEPKQLLKINPSNELLEIGDISNEYQVQLAQMNSDLEKMALMSKAISLIKERLDDKTVKAFSAMQNTRLGFKTDNQQGYPIPVVRDCLVECLMVGVKPIGNEFNIIGSNFYVTKEGFTGLMNRNPNFSKLDIRQEIPEYDHQNKRAIVKYSAIWNWRGNRMDTEGFVSVKLQYARSSGDCVTSDDAIYGKAERKIRCRVWNISTGDNLHEGDTEDLTESERLERAKNVSDTVPQKSGIAVKKPAAKKSPIKQQPPKDEKPKETPKPEKKKEEPKPQETTSTQQEIPLEEKETQEKPAENEVIETEAIEQPKQDDVYEKVYAKIKEKGISEDEFMEVAFTNGVGEGETIEDINGFKEGQLDYMLRHWDEYFDAE